MPVHEQCMPHVLADMQSNRLPKHGTVTLYLIDISTYSDGELRGLQQELPPYEQERAAGISKPEVRARFVLGRTVAYQVLARLGLPPEIAISNEGKPYFPSTPELNFNLSHSGRYVVAGFAYDAALGVDIQSQKCVRSFDDIAEFSFHSDEKEVLMRTFVDEKQEMFYRIWSAKEAVIKALGLSIFGSSNAFDLGDVEGADVWKSLVRSSTFDARAARFMMLELVPGYSSAICLINDDVDPEVCCFATKLATRLMRS